MTKSLFPPFLNKGSGGAAVKYLQQQLCALGYDEGLVCDGDYGDFTAARVRDLQGDLGFSEGLDGNFGPETRAALKKKRGIDVMAILASPKNADAQVTFWIGPNTPDGKREMWQPAAA